MKFTLIFETTEESIDLSYGLVFIPSPAFVRGQGELIINLNPENPHYLEGSLKKLIEKENLYNIYRCVVVIHNTGNGTIKDMDALKKDLENTDIKYKIITFEELK